MAAPTPRQVMPELQHYYEALAKASGLASEDPDWNYAWRRLEELTSLVEDVVAASRSLGWDIPSWLYEYGRRLAGAVEQGSHEVMRVVLEAEERVREYSRRALAARLYVTTLRQVASAALTLTGLAVIFYSQSVATTVLGIIAAGLGVSAWLLYKTVWSNHNLVAGLVVVVAAIILEPPGQALLLAFGLTLAVSILSIPLSRSLHRLFGAREV